MLFESIEIRKVCNGVIVTVRGDDDQEYVYDTDRKAIKAVKELLESKPDSVNRELITQS